MTISQNIRALREARATDDPHLIQAAQRSFKRTLSAMPQYQAYQVKIMARLDNISTNLKYYEQIPLTEAPIGLCTRERACLILQMPSLPNGKIFTECPAVPGLTDKVEGFISMGMLENGTPVPTCPLPVARIARQLRELIRQWANPQDVIAMEEQIAAAFEVLSSLACPDRCTNQ